MLDSRDVVRVRSEVTISALQSAAVHLGSHQGRTQGDHLRQRRAHGSRDGSADLISELTRNREQQQHGDLHRRPGRAALGGSADVLRTIAENTGAEAFVNTNTPEKALRQVVREASAFYLLGYASTRNPQDGKFHKIGVKVKRSGIDVRARRGYWAPAATELEKARAEAAAVECDSGGRDERDDRAVRRASRAIRRHLGRRRARRRRSADGDGRVDAARGGRPRRRVADGLDHRQRRRRRSDVRREPRRRRAVVSVASRRDAAAVHGPRRGRQRSSTKIAGRSACRICPARSSRSSAPVLLRARTIADARTLAEGRQASPFAGREFNRTDHVFVRFTIYGAPAAAADASARLTTKAGVSLLELPIAKMAGRRRCIRSSCRSRRLRAATT